MSNIYLTFVGASGQAYKGTVERLSDGFFREDDAETFVSSPLFTDKDIALAEGANENLGTYRAAVNGASWSNGLYQFRVHQSGVPYKTVGASVFAVKDGNEVAVGEESSVFDVFHVDTGFNKDSNGDEYTTTWFKNGVPTPMTDSYLAVQKRDGTYLVPFTVMTQIGSTASYKLNTITSQVQTAGESYVAIASGNLGGLAYTFPWVLGRDIES